MVGVDGSSSSGRALDWAIAEAQRTGDTLRLVGAWMFPMALGYALTTTVHEVHDVAQDRVDRAAARVAERGPRDPGHRRDHRTAAGTGTGRGGKERRAARRGLAGPWRFRGAPVGFGEPVLHPPRRLLGGRGPLRARQPAREDDGTIVTGTDACSANSRLVLPSSVPAWAPDPREPTTSRIAVSGRLGHAQQRRCTGRHRRCATPRRRGPCPRPPRSYRHLAVDVAVPGHAGVLQQPDRMHHLQPGPQGDGGPGRPRHGGLRVGRAVVADHHDARAVTAPPPCGPGRWRAAARNGRRGAGTARAHQRSVPAGAPRRPAVRRVLPPPRTRARRGCTRPPGRAPGGRGAARTPATTRASSAKSPLESSSSPSGSA